MALPLWFMVSITIGVVVMTITLILQLGLMLSFYVGVRSLQQKIERLLENQVQPILNSARGIAEDAQKQVHHLAETLEDIAESARNQVSKVDQVMTEATDRARLAIIRVDEVMADTLRRFEETTTFLQRNIVKPVQEIQAVLHGVARGLGYIMRQRRNPEDATQDEELFI